MVDLSKIQRVQCMLAGAPVDRLPAAEDFWSETISRWVSEGHLQPDESPVEHFDLDMDRGGLINCYADPDFGLVKIEETDEIVIYLDGNGAKMKHHKLHASTPGHVDYKIYDRKTWEEFARPDLCILNRSRIPFAEYRRRKNAAEKKNRYFMSDGFGPFEMMHRILGHEVLLLNMALEPEWIKDMVEVYTEFNIRHWDMLLQEEGLPHGTWIAEDLGYKFKPFMSPAMFEDLLLPSFVRMFDYLHAKGLTVFMHSCGFIEPLLPSLIEAGLDCYEAIEAKAGNDLGRLFSKFGDRLVYFGNIDMRVLERNDLSLVKKELKEKVEPLIRNGGRYILHSDHSISPKVDYDTYRAFLEIGRGILKY